MPICAQTFRCNRMMNRRGVTGQFQFFYVVFFLLLTNKTDFSAIQIQMQPSSSPKKTFYIIFSFCLFSISVFEEEKMVHIFKTGTGDITNDIITHLWIIASTLALCTCVSSLIQTENRYRVNWWIVSMWDRRHRQTINRSISVVPITRSRSVRSIIMVCTECL